MGSPFKGSIGNEKQPQHEEHQSDKKNISFVPIIPAALLPTPQIPPLSAVAEPLSATYTENIIILFTKCCPLPPHPLRVVQQQQKGHPIFVSLLYFRREGIEVGEWFQYDD